MPPSGAGPDWDRTRHAFLEAAGWFEQITTAAGGRWDEPALGEWTVRDLVGHTSRALATVETYLDAAAEGGPTTAVRVGSPVDYFALLRVGAAAAGSAPTRADPGAVAERGRQAGRALGEDVAGAVAALADRVRRRVESVPGDVLVAGPVATMLLVDYLPTRTFELTVHTCDLAVALDQPPDPPEAAAAESTALLGRLAARNGQAGVLLRAATGRGGLPDGFSVL